MNMSVQRLSKVAVPTALYDVHEVVQIAVLPHVDVRVVTPILRAHRLHRCGYVDTPPSSKQCIHEELLQAVIHNAVEPGRSPTVEVELRVGHAGGEVDAALLLASEGDGGRLLVQPDAEALQLVLDQLLVRDGLQTVQHDEDLRLSRLILYYQGSTIHKAAVHNQILWRRQQSSRQNRRAMVRHRTHQIARPRCADYLRKHLWDRGLLFLYPAVNRRTGSQTHNAARRSCTCRPRPLPSLAPSMIPGKSSSCIRAPRYLMTPAPSSHFSSKHWESSTSVEFADK